jgi:hypothetical protein
MNRKVAFAVGAMAICALLPAARLVTAQVLKTQANAPSFLFVQTARKIDYKDGVMTLYDVPPQTMFFTDRPQRVVGQIPTDRFVTRWTEDKSPNGFATNPPNAAVTVFQSDGPKTAIVALSNPRYDGKNLAYSVRVLQGIGSAQPAEGVLFIDNYGGWAENAFYGNLP